MTVACQCLCLLWKLQTWLLRRTEAEVANRRTLTALRASIQIQMDLMDLIARTALQALQVHQTQCQEAQVPSQEMKVPSQEMKVQSLEMQVQRQRALGLLQHRPRVTPSRHRGVATAPTPPWTIIIGVASE